jgi:endoglycosylceramidase
VRPLLLALLALLAAAAPAGAAVRVRDGRLLDERGRTVILHGVNVVYKVAPYLPNGSDERTSFDAQDAARLRGWGMNAIRLGVTWKALEPTRSHVDLAYVEGLRRIMRIAAKQNLLVLLDLHQDQYSERYRGNGAPEWATLDDGIVFPPVTPGFPYDYGQPAVGRAFTNFWEDQDGVRSEYVRAYASLARKLRTEPNLIGYDAFNEPSCELAAPPCGLPPQPGAAGRWLAPFYDQLVPALNRADPEHPVLYEEWFTSDFGYPFGVGYPPNPRWRFRNQGLSYHIYCGYPVRSDEQCPDQEREAANRAQGARAHNGVWPLITEFGATDDPAVLLRVTATADAAGHGWLYWQYKTYFDPTTSASMTGNPDAESIVDQNGQVKTDKLGILARPYPERIAGTGAHWSFDPAIDRFELRWRASRRADTVVRIPFPHYKLAVTGARVVRRGATLRLRGRGRPATVVLTPR